MTNTIKRIIIHWTAGTYNVNSHELDCYHYLVSGGGQVVVGNKTPEDNLCCTDGKYAAHTGGGNTGSIGVSMCGMLGFKDKTHLGTYPINKKQFERCMELVAELCIKYNLKVTPDTVMTHLEFGEKHPNTSSAGKIDIAYIPPYPWVETNEVGDFIRNKVRWYKAKQEK